MTSYRLHHHSLDPQSRFIRLALSELGIEVELVDEAPWERREEFLRLNPAGSLPVLVGPDKLAVPGAAIIAEYLDETFGDQLAERRLLPKCSVQRIEVRRLTDWFVTKFHAEVTDYLVTEKITKRFLSPDEDGGAPEMSAIRAAKANMRYHLSYIGHLARKRHWLAGDTLTYADLAAAAHLSVVDYLGDVPWEEDQAAKDWYARVKSRPAFRPLLQEQIRGVTPAPTYADLDF